MSRQRLRESSVQWNISLTNESFAQKVIKIVEINAVKNKELSPKQNLRSYKKELVGSDARGVNAMSIAEITGIPRPTVVRKLKYLIDKKFLHINEKKLITYNAKDSAFQKTSKMIDRNMLSLSDFIYRVFNQIKIINSN